MHSALSRRPKALIFDTGGTVFDWHSGLLAAFTEIGRRRGIAADWPAVTKTWRRLSTTQVDNGLPERFGVATLDMDDIHYVTLFESLSEHGVEGVRESDVLELLEAWHRLDAWPDVREGLARLRSMAYVVPFTILRTMYVVDASRRAGLEWDAVFSCEMVGVYKTNPVSYATAAKWLDLPHAEVMLVTTHNNDLRAGHRYGMTTAFVRRPHEWGDIPSPGGEPSDVADIVADDFVDLAEQIENTCAGQVARPEGDAP